MEKLGPRVRVRAVQPLRGFTVLISFKTEGGTIAWDNGADIDPDVLYHNLKPAWME
jgi:Protein of unknown function (DUF2442)